MTLIYLKHQIVQPAEGCGPKLRCFLVLKQSIESDFLLSKLWNVGTHDIIIVTIQWLKKVCYGKL